MSLVVGVGLGALALAVLAWPVASAAQTVAADLAPAIETMTKGTDTAARMEAAKALGASRDARALEALVKALEDPSRDVRWAAVEALGELGDRRAVPPILDYLKRVEAYRWGKRLAAAALGAIGDPRAVEPLVALLEDDDPFVRRAAALALLRLEDPRGLAKVTDLLKDQSDATLGTVRREMARFEAERSGRPAAPVIARAQASGTAPLRPREWAGLRVGVTPITEVRRRLGEPLQQTAEFVLYGGDRVAAPLKADSVVVNTGAGGVIESIFVFPVWGTMDRDIRALLGPGKLMPYAEFLKATGRTAQGAGTNAGGKLHYLPPDAATESFAEMGMLAVYDAADPAARERLVKLLIVY